MGAVEGGHQVTLVAGSPAAAPVAVGEVAWRVRRLAVQVEVHRTRRRPRVGRPRILAHAELDLEPLVRPEDHRGLIGARGGRRRLRRCRADQELRHDGTQQARPPPGFRGRGWHQGFAGLAVGLRLGGELRLDLAHLSQAQRLSHAGRIDAVFGGQDDGHQKARGGDDGDRGGAQQLPGGRQFGAGREVGVVHGQQFLRTRTSR
jgi:hypothetical protein